MIYKGYQAVIEFDEIDRLFVGRVINTRDVIAFDGASVDELEQSFHTAIDEYLDDCAVVGKDPEKPFSGRFNLRIAPELHRLAAAQAEHEDVSLNSLVELALQAYISSASKTQNLVPFRSSDKQPANRKRMSAATKPATREPSDRQVKTPTSSFGKAKTTSKSTRKASSPSHH
jgi:predicted HicB family RNase H-like nuclease